MYKRSLAFLLSFVLASVPRLVAQEPVDYLVRVDDPSSGLFHIEVTVPATASATLVSLPAWTPGYYEINNYARNVRDFAAFDGEGSPLRWELADKDTWRVFSQGGRRVRVSYDFLADNLSLDGSVLGSDFGLFNGTNLFVYPEKNFDFPARVRFELPTDWRVATELEESEDGVYTAADFHELVDNPTFLGHFAIDSARADGRWIRLALYPADAIPERARAVMLDALQRIADYSHDLFGEPPYERYTTFMYLHSGQANSSGGLEHANSQLDIMPNVAYESAEQMRRGFGFGLLSHEYYHAWNVKRIRPAEMWPYDYESEQYTPLLWVSEGFTSYYGPLILARTGLSSEDQFWSTMQDNINDVESQPYQASVEDISLATWIEPRPIGSGYYYSKGSLIGLLLDIEIRAATANRNSLDDVMYRLYHDHYRHSRGFTTRDLLDYVAEYVGEDVTGRFYRAYIDGREPLPYGDVLELAGIAFRVDTIVEPLLGVYADYGEAGTVSLAGIVPGSSAAEVGLQAGDQLLRVGTIDIAGQDWAPRFREVYADSVGLPLVVEYSRDGERMSGATTIRTRTRYEHRLEPMTGASDAQLALRRGLLAGSEP